MPLNWPFDPRGAENIARLYTLVRGSEVIRWTDNFEAITVGGDTWTREPGVKMSSAEFNTNGDVSTFNIEISKRNSGTSPLNDADLLLGRFDGCPFQCVAVDTSQLSESPSPFGHIFTGRFGKIRTGIGGQMTIVCRGPLTLLRKEMAEKWGLMCRADFGDARCRKPVMPPDIQRGTFYPKHDGHNTPYAAFVRVRMSGIETPYPYNYGNLYWECTQAGTTAGVQPSEYDGASPDDEVTDGTAVFIARNALMRAAEVDEALTAQAFTVTELPDSRANVDDYFALGNAIVRSGRYDGQIIPIRGWDFSTLRVRTWFICSHMFDEPGTVIELHPGCAKTEAACLSNDNVWNRRAETIAPGKDAAQAQA